VTGQVVDTIDRLSTSLYEGVPNDPLVDSNSGRIAYQGMTDRDLEDAMLFDVSDGDGLHMDDLSDLCSPECRNLLTDLPPNLLHWLDTNEDFLVYTRRDIEKEILKLEEGHKEFNITMNRLEWVLKYGTRLFVTIDGFLGIAHAQARKGDNVCLIRGCHMPVILRRAGDAWNVIGEAYPCQYQELDLKDEGMVQFSLI
jgi:hypothetical protein